MKQIKKIFTPAFFDIFGLVTFTFLLFLGHYSLFYPLSLWMSIAIIVIGLLGIIVDGTIVYRTYLKKK